MTTMNQIRTEIETELANGATFTTAIFPHRKLTVIKRMEAKGLVTLTVNPANRWTYIVRRAG